MRYRFRFVIEGSQELIGDEKMTYGVALDKAKGMAAENFYDSTVKIVKWQKEENKK